MTKFKCDMQFVFKPIFLFIVFLLQSIIVHSQINPALRLQSWPAHWVSCPDEPLREYGVYFFRKKIILEKVPASFIIHVTADNRYKLYVNGKEISKGPARSDSRNWHFETVNITPFLNQGENVLGAVVWNQGEHKPLAQHSEMTGLLIQSDQVNASSFQNQPVPFSAVNTDRTWKVIKSPAYKPYSTNTMAKLQSYAVVGCGDHTNANFLDTQWMTEGYDDSSWKNARILERGMPKGLGSGAHWHLTPRTIPPMDETKKKFSSVRRSDCNINDQFIHQSTTSKTIIPPNTKCKILIDNGVLSVGYPVLNISGGKNASIELEYSEALFDTKNQKGNRNEIEGKEIKGYTDLFISNGAQNFTFSTLWLRTFRYIQLSVETKQEPLILEDFHHVTSIYPLIENASFSSSDETMTDIWKTGWNTARLCALESYVDCPYYEQLQYVGDTRIQALITMYVDGDDKLVRKALTDIHNSVLPEGLTQSRYPSYVQQVIPPFSLYWVAMVYDHYMHYGDTTFTKQFIPAVEGVLHWFQSRIDPKSQMLKPLEWWNFVDWAKEWEWNSTYSIGGVPSGVKEGKSSVASLQYAYTLQLASELFKQLGNNSKSIKYSQQAAAVNGGCYKACYDVSRGLMADTPDKTMFSQHANIFGILSGAFTSAWQQNEVLTKLMEDKNLINASYYFRFYLHQAFVKTNNIDLYYTQLKPWKDMLQLGLTTFAEKPEPTRSDCHAWSASPNYDFLNIICGIRPLKPGFKEVVIRPSLAGLDFIKGKMPLNKGYIETNLRKSGKTLVEGEVILPTGVKGFFEWKGKKIALKSGENKIRL